MARLKKGSKEAKAWGRKMKRLRSGSRPKKRKSKSSVIKYKPKRKRTMAKRKTKRRSTSIMGINTAKALAAGLYGAMRGRTSSMLAPYTSKIPLGNVSDEVGMLLVASLGKKYLFKKAGTLREALTAGQTIELARIGEAVATGNLGISLGNMGGSQSTGYNFA